MERASRFTYDMGKLRLKDILADNVRAIAGNESKQKDVRAKTGLSSGPAHRILKGQNVNLETLERIADSTRFPAWQLLFDKFDPNNPPQILSKALQDEIMELREEVAILRSALAQIRSLAVSDDRVQPRTLRSGSSHSDSSDKEPPPHPSKS